MLPNYGITIDGEFIVICERRDAIHGPFVRKGLGARIWRWIRQQAQKLRSPEWSECVRGSNKPADE